MKSVAGRKPPIGSGRMAGEPLRITHRFSCRTEASSWSNDSGARQGNRRGDGGEKLHGLRAAMSSLLRLGRQRGRREVAKRLMQSVRVTTSHRAHMQFDNLLEEGAENALRLIGALANQKMQ